MNKSLLKTGQVLPNGAVVLRATIDKVLAIRNKQYMYWTYSINPTTGEVETYWGHYFGTQLQQAYLAFMDATAPTRTA